MAKKKETGNCKACEHYSSFNNTCLKKGGEYYKKTGYDPEHGTCDSFKKPKVKKYELKEEDFVSNPWLEWKKKRMIYETEE